jgi:hypothetical protein
MMQHNLKAYIKEYYRYWFPHIASVGLGAGRNLPSYGAILNGIDKTARKPFVLDAGLVSGNLFILRFSGTGQREYFHLRGGCRLSLAGTDLSTEEEFQ